MRGGKDDHHQLNAAEIVSECFKVGEAVSYEAVDVVMFPLKSGRGLEQERFDPQEGGNSVFVPHSDRTHFWQVVVQGSWDQEMVWIGSVWGMP